MHEKYCGSNWNFLLTYQELKLKIFSNQKTYSNWENFEKLYKLPKFKVRKFPEGLCTLGWFFQFSFVFVFVFLIVFETENIFSNWKTYKNCEKIQNEKKKVHYQESVNTFKINLKQKNKNYEKNLKKKI